MAFLQDAQRRRELAAKVSLPSPEARQCGQRLHQRAPAQVLAKVAFHAPHADHHVGRHAGLLLDAAQRVLPLGVRGAPVGHALVIDQHGDVVPHGQGELRLAIQQHQHRGVGRQALGEPGEAGGVDGAERGRALQLRQAAAEGGFIHRGRLLREGAAQQQGGGCQRQRAAPDGGEGFVHSKMIADCAGVACAKVQILASTTAARARHARPLGDSRAPGCRCQTAVHRYADCLSNPGGTQPRQPRQP